MSARTIILPKNLPPYPGAESPADHEARVRKFLTSARGKELERLNALLFDDRMMAIWKRLDDQSISAETQGYLFFGALLAIVRFEMVDLRNATGRREEFEAAEKSINSLLKFLAHQHNKAILYGYNFNSMSSKVGLLNLAEYDRLEADLKVLKGKVSRILESPLDQDYANERRASVLNLNGSDLERFVSFSIDEMLFHVRWDKVKMRSKLHAAIADIINIVSDSDEAQTTADNVRRREHDLERRLKLEPIKS